MKQLKHIVQSEVEKVDQVIRSVDLADPAVYALWAAQTYYYVCHSTRLLALSASRFPQSKDAFHKRFCHHISEESGHEHLARRDVKAVGFDVADLPELPATKAFYQTQYYQIEHIDAMAFWGYILCLETLAVHSGDWMLEIARKTHGSDAVNFLKLHNSEDVDHLEKAYRTLEDLDNNVFELIQDNLMLSSSLYSDMVRQCAAFAEAKTAAA